MICFSVPLHIPGDGLLQSLLELNQRPPVEPLHGPADVGTAPLRVIDDCGNVVDAGLAADDLRNQGGDLIDGELDRISQVDRPGLS